jgi:DNA-binding NarL/FixJ family response regulator
VTVVRVGFFGGTRAHRDSLAKAFESEADLTVVASAPTTAIGDACLRVACPHVVVLDVAANSSVATVRAVRAVNPDLRVVLLGVDESPQCVVPLIEAGALGYATEDSPLEQLIDTVRSVARGEAVVSPRAVASLAARLVEIAERRGQATRTRPLTARESEILRLIDEGLSNKEIAARLCIEVPTVKNHVHNILDKLHARRRGEAAARLRI